MDLDVKTLSLFASLFIAWSALLVGIIKWLVDRAVSSIEHRFTRNENEHKALRAAHEELEKDYRSFLTQLPVMYVQREDWIRFATAIDAKLDRLWDRLVNTWGKKTDA